MSSNIAVNPVNRFTNILRYRIWVPVDSHSRTELEVSRLPSPGSQRTKEGHPQIFWTWQTLSCGGRNGGKVAALSMHNKRTTNPKSDIGSESNMNN